MVVTADDGRGGTVSDAFEIEVSAAGALVLNVAAITGDDTVGIAEKAAGFAIAGDTGTEEGVAVTVEIGTATLTATSADPDSTDADDTATWSVDVPPDSGYIAGTGVVVTVSASKAGFTSPADEVRTLAVDLVAPTVAISGVPPTSGAPFTATFTFSEPAYGFSVGDIAVGNGTASAFSGTDGDRTFSALITPTADGTVTVDVAAGAAADAAGNGSLAAAQATSVYAASAAPSVLSVTVSPAPPRAGKVGEARCTKAWLDALPADAVHGPGATLAFTLTLDRDVTVTLAPVPDGAEEVRPELLLDVFNRERRAEYTGPVGTPVRSLAFGWTVRRGDYDPDGIRVAGIALNGAAVRAAGGADLASGSFPAQGFEAHRVRGGYFAVSLDLEAMEEEAREGVPFAFRVTRDGGFGERAVAFVHVDDGGAGRGRTLAVELPPGGTRLLGGAVADGRSGEGRATPAADGRADAGRTLGLRLVRAESGCTGGEPPSWYEVAAPAAATVPVADAAIAPAADGTRLLVGPAGAGERDAGRVPMTFRVCLWTGSLCPDAGRNPAFEAWGGLGHEVRVAYATRDGTATAGADYVAAVGTLVFAPGETVKTVDVEILPDDHDEGKETVWLELSAPVGAAIGRGRNFGYIYNDGAIPRTWIARFGRTVAEQAIEAMEARFSAPRGSGFTGKLAGQSLAGFGNPGEGEAEQEEETARDLERLTDWLAGSEAARPETRALGGRDLLTGSSFTLTQGNAETGFGSIWGRGGVTRFDGREPGGLMLDGEVAGAMLGADFLSNRVLGGLMLTHSRGEGGYERSGDIGGTVESELTALFPYGRVAVSKRLSVWGMAGIGGGSLTLTPWTRGTDGNADEEADDNRQPGAPLRPDLSFLMGAAGVRGVLLDGAGGGPALTLKSDAMTVRTSTDAVSGGGPGSGTGGNLAAADADVTRLRLALEGSQRVALGAGAVLTPEVEVGLRHDGGDAETGFGLDIGAGLSLSDQARGISSDIRARWVLSHEDDGMRARGVSGSLSWDPAPETERGLVVELRQTMGGPSSGGTNALFGRTAIADAVGAGDHLDNRHLEARLGYGFGAFDDRWTVVPEFGLDLLDGVREYRAGGRLVEQEDSDPAFDVGLEVTRREQAGVASAEQGVALRFGWGERVAPDLAFDAGLEVTRREQAGVAGAEHGAALGFGWRLDGAEDRGLELRLGLSGREAANDNQPPETAVGLMLSARW